MTPKCAKLISAMKLKKSDDIDTEAPTMPVTGGAVIADRFKLDVDDGAPKGPAGVGKVGATFALIGSLAAIAALGLIAWLLYQNWELIKDF